MTKITVILPAYNKEISIGSMVIGAKKYADNVIVIDDGSTDNTAEIARLAGADVIKHSSNQGKGAALKTGFKAIRDTDIIVTMDSDGQHKPEDIKKLVSSIENSEADLVNGSRYLNRKKNDTPAYRRVGQSILDKATNIGSRLNITDSQSGFRAFAAHTLPAFRFYSSNFGIESEMLMDAAKAGLRIKEIEIGVRYDVDGSTKDPVSHGLEVLMKIINEIEFRRPLYYFTLPGIIIIIIGLVLGLKFFGEYLADPTTSLAPTILAILLTCCGGFLALTGIILDSMSRMISRLLNTDIDFSSYDKNQRRDK
ncbi:MAG: glycosyltransferase family 2 protein [Methanobacterium sp.]|jgi:glycosyltransferase involved in cell wall biosynthesis